MSSKLVSNDPVHQLVLDSEAARMRDAFIAKMPERVRCPKCNRKRAREEFGVRVPRFLNKITGMVILGKAKRQSYCQDCRNGKIKMSKPVTKKVTVEEVKEALKVEAPANTEPTKPGSESDSIPVVP